MVKLWCSGKKTQETIKNTVVESLAIEASIDDKM
jgi:hypothetical protein